MPVPISAAQKDGHRPLWSLADLTQVLPAPALDQIRNCQYFLVENARTARAFIKAAAHPLPIASLEIIEIGHEPDAGKLNLWLMPLTGKAGPVRDAVVLSEAGCPGIADPGATLVARAHTLGLRVLPWVGPSAILLALMGSGLSGQAFRFHGYLPQDKGQLSGALHQLESAAQQGETQIFMETPYRNTKLYQNLLEHCQNSTLLCLAIDLNSPDSTLQTRTIAQWRGLKTPPVLDKRPAVFLLGKSA